MASASSRWAGAVAIAWARWCTAPTGTAGSWRTTNEYLKDEHFEAITRSGERFVAVGHFDGAITYSSDGDHWQPAREFVTYYRLNGVIWGNGRFVAVGWNETIVTSL